MTVIERSSWGLLSELFMALSKDLEFRNSEVGELVHLVEYLLTRHQTLA